MAFIYTDHVEKKLLRPDVRNFHITKSILDKAVSSPDYPLGKTRTGEFASIINLEPNYILRVVYDKMGQDIKIITFYIARKGRYGT